MLDVQVELGADGAVPTEFCIFRSGVTETTKGPVRFTARAGKSVMGRMANLGRDALPFDYGHGQVSMLKSHESQRAAGWFKPEVRMADAGPELWATDIHWTPTARQALADKEYRYFSPTLYRDSETGEVTELTNIALTNLPATKNQTPLVGLDTQGNFSVEIETLLAAFGVKDLPEAVAKVTKLTTENGQLLDAVKSLQTELADAKTALAKVAEERVATERSNLVEQLGREGKLPPALKPWALSQSLDSLKAFAAVAPVAPAAKAPVQPEKRSDGTDGVSLSSDELKICKQMGVKPEQYAKTRTLLSSQASFWAARADGEQWTPPGE